jgi:hypothetical protein
MTVDGITVANGYDGTQIGPLYSYIESFEEFRIDMANNTAEFGAIGQVTVVSKGGSNDFHGVGLDYYTTPMFRARDPFALQRGAGVSHSLGILVNGPLMLPKIYNGRNKSFFSFAYETSLGSQVQQLLTPTMPLASWRTGDFSTLTPGTVVRDFFANNAPFAGTAIPASRISLSRRKSRTAFSPLPNFGNPAVPEQPELSRAETATVRSQHQCRGTRRSPLSDKVFLFGRFTWDRQYSRQYTGGLPTIGQNWQTRSTRGINISYTHSIRPNLLNEFRYGFAYNNNPRNPPTLGKGGGAVSRDSGPRRQPSGHQRLVQSRLDRHQPYRHRRGQRLAASRLRELRATVSGAPQLVPWQAQPQGGRSFHASGFQR